MIKTKMVNATKTSFDFLGFTIRYSKDLFTEGRRYWDIFPSRSQRKSRLYRQKAFERLVSLYGLIDPTKYAPERLPVKAYEEVYGKAVCGKTARTV